MSLSYLMSGVGTRSSLMSGVLMSGESLTSSDVLMSGVGTRSYLMSGVLMSGEPLMSTDVLLSGEVTLIPDVS